MEVFQWELIAVDSIKKKTVDATIAMETIQNEIATGSFGLRNPFKSASCAVEATAAKIVDMVFAMRSNSTLDKILKY
jgi:hypothetical protein